MKQVSGLLGYTHLDSQPYKEGDDIVNTKTMYKTLRVCVCVCVNTHFFIFPNLRAQGAWECWTGGEGKDQGRAFIHHSLEKYQAEHTINLGNEHCCACVCFSPSCFLQKYFYARSKKRQGIVENSYYFSS